MNKVMRFVTLVLLASLSLGPGCKRTRPPLEPQVLVSDDPKAEKAFRSAEDRYTSGDLKGALGEFAQFIADFHDDPLLVPAKLYCGRIALEIGELDRAMIFFKQIEGDANSTEERAAFYVGVVLFRQGKTEQSVDVLQRFVGRLFDRDENLLLYDCLWRAAVQLGSPADGVVWTDDYLDLSPPVREAEEARAAQVAALALIDDPTTLERISKVIDPKKQLWLQVVEQLARLEFEAGRFEDALEWVERAEERGVAEDSNLAEIGRLIRKRLTVDLSSIGCILPVTGRARLIGQSVIEGVMLGADSVDLGAARPRLAVVTRDSKGDPEEAVRAVDELFQVENVALLVGMIDSKAGLAAAQRAEEYGIPVIALSIQDEITQLGENVFRHFVTNRAEVKSLLGGYRDALARQGAAALEDAQSLRLAVLHPQNGYGQQMTQALSDELEQLGTSLVGSVSYLPTQTSFTEEAASLAELEFDALFIPDGHNRIGLIAPALAAAGLWSGAADSIEEDTAGRRFVQLLIPSVGYGSDLGRRAGRYLEGAIFSMRYFEGAEPATEDFAFRFRDRYGKEPTYFAAYGYDAVVIAASALGGEFERRREIRQWLHRLESTDQLIGATTTPFEGFDEDGEPNSLPRLVRMKGGQLQELAP